MPFPVGAAISAVGGLVGSGLNALSQRAANNRSWRQTKQLFGMQQADRNAQNVYNSPANQVALLKSAGLSPASFYGGAAQSAGSAGVATPGSPEVGAADLATPISSVSGAIGNLIMLGAQKRNIESDTDKNLAQIANEYAQTARTEFDLDMARTLKQTTLAQAQASLDKTIQETATSKAQELLNVVDKEYRAVGIELTKSQMSLNEKEKEKWDAEIRNLGYKNIESLTQAEKNRVDTQLAAETARQVCYSIEHVLPAMVADYAASADLKTTQAWDSQENAKFQQFYNENIAKYLPEQIAAEVANMNAETKAVLQENIRDWIHLPADMVRDVGIGIGAIKALSVSGQGQTKIKMAPSGRAPVMVRESRSARNRIGY